MASDEMRERAEYFEMSDEWSEHVLDTDRSDLLEFASVFARSELRRAAQEMREQIVKVKEHGVESPMVGLQWVADWLERRASE